MQIIEAKFSDEYGKRLDVFVAAVADISRSRAAQLIEESCVTVNDNTASKNTKPKPCDNIKIQIQMENSDNQLLHNIFQLT